VFKSNNVFTNTTIIYNIDEENDSPLLLKLGLDCKFKIRLITGSYNIITVLILIIQIVFKYLA